MQSQLKSNKMTAVNNAPSNLDTYSKYIQNASAQYGIPIPTLSALLESQSAFTTNQFANGKLNAQQYIDGASQAFAMYLQKNNGNVANAVLDFNGITNPTASDYANYSGTILAAGGTIPANNSASQPNSTPTLWGSFLSNLGNSQTSQTVNFSFLNIFKNGGWGMILLLIAATVLFFGISGLIKENKNG